MLKSKKTLLLKALLSICFFFFFATFLQGHELLAMFKNVNWFYFTLSFALLPVLFCLSCLKWKIMFDAGNMHISFRKLIKFYLVGYFFSNLLPSNIGGDMARIYYAGREINSLPFAAVTVFIERFSGLVFLLLLVSLAPFFKKDSITNPYIIVPALGAFAILLLIFLLWRCRFAPEKRASIAQGILKRIDTLYSHTQFTAIRFLLNKLSKLTTFFFTKLDRFGSELQQALSVLRIQKIYVVKIIALTIIFYACTWINVMVAFLSFNCHVQFSDIMALVPTILFVGQLPITLLGNLGFFESVFVFYFLFAGIPGEATLAMGLLLRFRNVCLGCIGYITYITSCKPIDRVKNDALMEPPTKHNLS